MDNHTVFKEAIDAALSAVKELIGNNQVAWCDMLAQAANGTDGNHVFDTQALQGPDIGTHRNLCWVDAMSAPMTRQKGHGGTIDVAYRDDIAGISKGRLHLDLFHLGHALHAIEAATANHTNRCLWHMYALLYAVILTYLRLPNLRIAPAWAGTVSSALCMRCSSLCSP